MISSDSPSLEEMAKALLLPGIPMSRRSVSYTHLDVYKRQRVLYSMIELNNGPDKPHRKSARIVGDTTVSYTHLGKAPPSLNLLI